MGIVSILTVMVALAGYVREATLAARFGLSATMDAYFGATFVPTLAYMILVAGTLSPVFIPILLQYNAVADRAKLSEVFSVLTNFVLLVLAGVALVGMISAGKWMPLLFPGYSAATLRTSVQLIYIIFPSVLFVALAGVFTSALNGFHKFALAAFAPAVSSIAVTSAALLARGDQAVYVVGAATAIGFFLQFALLVPATWALGIRYRPVFNLRHPAIAKLLRLGGPLFLYISTSNVMLFVERNLASRLPVGSVSAINYATRLFAVPSNFLAAPLAIVAYPHFATEALREGYGGLRAQVAEMLRMVIFLFLPITAWTVLNALPLTRLLYERGQFRPEDSLATSRVLMLYGIGILPFAIGVVLLRCFYAIQDTITPFVAELIGLCFYAAAAPALSRAMGLEGLALTRGVSFYLVAAIFVMVLWRKRQVLALDLDLALFSVRVAVAAGVMAVVSWLTLHLLQPWFDSSRTPGRGLVVLAVFLASGLTFLAVAQTLKLHQVQRILKTARELLPANGR